MSHLDKSTKETTVATAEVAPRGLVQAQARVETNAGETFAAAADQKRKAAESAAAKEDACSTASAAAPAAHAKAAIGDLGTTIGAKIDKASEGRALKKHSEHADYQEQRAHTETIEAKEKAREDARRVAEAKALAANKGKIVSEYREGKDIVVVAEVPARGMTVGTGIAESHAEDHLLRADRERIRVAEAAAGKADAEARLADAQPGTEAKAAVGGIGTKISAKLTEAKEWVAEKFHDRKGDSLETKAEKELAHDMELARQKAKSAAEAEANRLDRAAHAVVTSEKTVTSVTSTRA